MADYPESALWGKGGGGSGCNRGGGDFNSSTIVARSPLHLRNDHTGQRKWATTPPTLDIIDGDLLAAIASREYEQ